MYLYINISAFCCCSCEVDPTLKTHHSSNPMMNAFSVKAFKFKESLPGVTSDTDVQIQVCCTVTLLFCVKLVLWMKKCCK